MARVIEAVQIFKKVEDCTSAKDEAPPVYLMDDLAEMARGSADGSEKIAERIFKRLQHKSPVVKFKALRLTRHLLVKGCSTFQRHMHKYSSTLREHMHFKGESDPFKGDTLNQRVRDAAKEAVEALNNTVMAQPVNSLGTRIQGFGSAATPAPAQQAPSSGGAGRHSRNDSNGGGVAGGSRMVGFGSGSYTAPVVAPPAQGASGSGHGIFNGGQRGVNRPLTGGYGPDAVGSGAASGSGHYSLPTAAGVQVFGSEEQLVDSICTPGGLRLAPDPEDLRRFVEAVGSLDGLRVAELLRDKMDGSGAWQQLLRALYALEAVLQQGATQACGEIAVMFQSDPAPVQAAATHTQAAVRERAGRVLKALLGDAPPAATPSVASSGTRAGQAAGQVASLLDLGGPAPAAQGSGNTAAGARVQPQQQVVDLLGGLDVPGASYREPQPVRSQPSRPGASGAPARADSSDIFSGLSVPTGPLAQPGYAAGSGGAGPSYGQQDYMQSVPVQQQQQQPVHHHPQSQVYGLQTAGVPPPAVARPAVDIMGGGSMPSQAHASASQHAYGHAPAGSAAQAGAQPPAAQAPQQRNMAAPLDDLFSDMSLGAGSVSNAGPVRQGGSANGPGYAVANGPAYGSGAMPVGHKPGSSGMAGPVHAGGSFSGYGAPMGAVPQASTSGRGMGVPGGTSQTYGGLQATGHAAPNGMTQQQRPANGAIGGDLLGGYTVDLLGPSAAGGAGAGYGGSGMGYSGGSVGMATGMAGQMGQGLSMGGPGMGAGLGGGFGGMMVGPGGQVQYVPQPQQHQPYAGMGMGGGVSHGTGPMPAAQYGGALAAGAPKGASQAAMYGMPPQGQPQGGQQSHGGAFDFVSAQFK